MSIFADKKNILPLLLFLAVILLYPKTNLFAYMQNSYYAQGAYYAQSYYQSYYQSTYDTTFSTDVVMEETLYISGGISKSSGSFVIDHPLDPENKLLYHSFVESPDVKNIYDGLATLDGNGEAVVTLPHYFEALSKEYRYQVKAVSKPAPNLHIKKEIEGNQFTIAGGPANASVSWQVTGIRKDPYILANPIIPEVEKGPDQLVDKGEYLFEGYESKTNSDEIFFALFEFLRKLWRNLLDWVVFWR